MNYVLKSVKVSGFTQRHRAAKFLSTWWMFYPGSSFWMPYTALTHSCCFPLLFCLQPKEFIWIRLVQGFNLNCRSIWELEPERPVVLTHSLYRRWTKRASKQVNEPRTAQQLTTDSARSIHFLILLARSTNQPIKVTAETCARYKELSVFCLSHYCVMKYIVEICGLHLWTK